MDEGLGPNAVPEKAASKLSQFKKHIRSRWFWGSLAVILVFFIVMISLKLDMQWFWLLLYAIITVPFAPFIRSPIKFFRYSFLLISDTCVWQQ